MASIALPPAHDTVLKLMIRGIRDTEKKPKGSLAGETVIVTGSNIGIGFACAKILPTLGVSRLIMAVRSIEKGDAAATKLRDLYPSTKIDVWELDMLSYSSIQAFAQRCYALPRLDVAILNAGLGGGPVNQINASTGHEETFQVNYLSTALLSVLLLPVLRAKTPNTQPGRLTIVGSGTALLAKFENRNAVPLIPSFDQPFSGVQAGIERYSTSKLLVKMLIQKLAEAVSADDVIINTVEPGLTNDTGLHRNFSKSGKAMMAVMKKLKSRTPEQAAWTYIDAVAAKGRESHGGFIMFWEVWAFPDIMYTAEGKAATERLWDETLEELNFAGVKDILNSMKKN